MPIKNNLSEINQDYVKTGKPISLSFDVPSLGIICCTRVLRAIQGKRITCLGDFGSHKVVAKLFFHARRAKNHWQRSYKGCHKFIERSITAPNILFSGYLHEYGVYMIVFEYIENAVRFYEALASVQDEDQRQELLNRLIGCLARHHQQGIIQYDMHMGNFLLKGKKIYSLDGDHVRSFKGPITKSRSLTNLCKLLSNFFPLLKARVLESYQAYCSAREWDPREKDTRKLIGIASGMRKRRLAKNVRKMYRSGSSFSVFKTSGYYSIRNRSIWNDRFKAISDHPELIIAQTSGEQLDGFHKYHLSIDDVPVTLYSARAFGYYLRRFGVVSRIWRNALRLNRLEIHTPRPVAIIEKRKRLMIWHAFLIVESWEGVVAQDFFLSNSVPERDKHIVAERIANAFLVMQQTGIAIRGVCSTNILISDLEPVFLDVLPFAPSIFSSRSGFFNSIQEFLQGWDHASEVRRLFHEKLKGVDLV